MPCLSGDGREADNFLLCVGLFEGSVAMVHAGPMDLLVEAIYDAVLEPQGCPSTKRVWD